MEKYLNIEQYKEAAGVSRKTVWSWINIEGRIERELVKMPNGTYQYFINTEKYPPHEQKRFQQKRKDVL